MKESVICQDILAEGLAEGIARGIAEEKNQIAINMLRSNMANELIAQITGLSIRQVEKLQKAVTAPAKKPKSSISKSPNQ
ncbi:hypothetical protein HCU40_08510 [Pseudanabaena biceps]|nr:hypothetical protein [Pseudanabaena biceps]